MNTFLKKTKETQNLIPGARPAWRRDLDIAELVLPHCFLNLPSVNNTVKIILIEEAGVMSVWRLHVTPLRSSIKHMYILNTDSPEQQ